MHSNLFLSNRRKRREKMLRKMANWRAAKARKRQERISQGLVELGPPKMRRYYPLEFGVRVKATGDTHFTDLKSVRHASKALGLVLKYI